MRARLLAAACLLFACGEKIQQQYRVTIIGPTGVDYLAGGTHAVMSISGRGEVARATITPGQPFSLSTTEVMPTGSGSIQVEVLDQNDGLVAFGQTPEINLVLFSPGLPLRVFVQKPGTFGRNDNLDEALHQHFGVTTAASGANLVPADVQLFGTGRLVVTQQNMPVEHIIDAYYVYNPLTQDVQEIASGFDLNRPLQPRTQTAALARADGTVLVFGGLAEAMAGATPTPTSLLDTVRVQRRTNFIDFGAVAARASKSTPEPAVARVATVLVEADTVYAVGGRDDKGPLDSIVAIDPTVETNTFRVLEARLAGTRERHTATAVSGAMAQEVLVFGGAPPDKPVAERLVTGKTPTIEAVTGGGPPRRGHAALVLPAPDGRVLILGGIDDTGRTLGDGLLYAPGPRTFAAAPFTLKTPRSAFAAFLMGSELVVVGGLDASGMPVGKAEVYELPGLTLKAELDAFPRAGASASVLQNKWAVVIGGEEAGGTPSKIVEIYQPAR